METREVIYAPKFTHEQAVEIFRRLVADKREAEQNLAENFATDPLMQESVARLKARQKQSPKPATNV